MLDTVIGSEAELVYYRLGYNEVGRIPRCGISPRGGDLVDLVFLFKDIRNY
jgi:hypothetical protein